MIALWCIGTDDSFKDGSGKIDSLSWKINWKWDCCPIFKKFSYWENLLQFWMLLSKASVNPFKHQSHKMVKHTQTIRRQSADELFECVWPFCEIGN